MTDTAVALEFVARFCDGDVAALGEILADDLDFRGPQLVAGSRREYLAALARDPPLPTPYRVLSVTANPAGEVAVFWQYLKPDGPLLVGQLCVVADRRIRRILLLFDAGAGARPAVATTADG